MAHRQKTAWCCAGSNAVPRSIARFPIAMQHRVAARASRVRSCRAMHRYAQVVSGAGASRSTCRRRTCSSDCKRLLCRRGRGVSPKLRLATRGARPLHAPSTHVHPSTHVGFHLGAVRGARRRQQDRTRQRPGGGRRRSGAARKAHCRASARAQVVVARLAVRPPRARDASTSRASTSSVRSVAARPC